MARTCACADVHVSCQLQLHQGVVVHAKLAEHTAVVVVEDRTRAVQLVAMAQGVKVAGNALVNLERLRLLKQQLMALGQGAQRIHLGC